MQVRFATVDESYIKTMVRNGYYTTENELVRDAVRRMREQDEKRYRFLAAVQIGDGEIENGETVAYTDALLDQLTQRVLRRAVEKDTPSSDVTP